MKYKYIVRQYKNVEGVIDLPEGLSGVEVDEAILAHVDTNTPEGMDVDHIDNDGLNNQDENLRVCTHAQNIANRGKQKHNTSGYKGIAWHKGNKMWQANITLNGKQMSVGYSKDPIEAAKKYDDAAKKYHGEFAVLNFP